MLRRTERSRGTSPGRTQGRWVAGSDDHRDWISGGGGGDADHDAAEQHWTAIRDASEPARLSITRDVEIKFAMFMRRHDRRSERIVINNPDGPCGFGRENFRFGCDQLLPRFLPAGATLTVAWPDGEKTYTGANDD